MLKPYEDRNLLYELYVKRRMTMTDIHKYFQEKYGYTGTSQTIYNHLKKNDLLKYRGKGRRQLNRNKPELSPAMKAAQAQRRAQKKKMKQRAAGKNS